MLKRHLRFVLATCIAASWIAPAQAAPISADQTARLIRLAEKGVSDTQGWATDMHSVLQKHDLEVSRENVCATIAIIDQESSFNPNPTVPGLGVVSENALKTKFGKVPVLGRLALNYLENYPSPDTSFMKRIRAAKTERDLDIAYRELVGAASKSTKVDLAVRIGLFNTLIEDKNEIDTAGSMQVSVRFAMDIARSKRWLPMALEDVYAVRDHLYTREGGMYYGVAQLLSYDTGYNAKIYRFADYNAGRYASRNAAFQRVVAKLSGQALAYDGDLLLYGKGSQILNKESSSEKAIQAIDQKFMLGLSKDTIRADLAKEKEQRFGGTATYIRLRDLFGQRTKTIAAFAEVPSIELSSPKIKRRMTTLIFAESVNRRYRACMIAKV